MKLVHLSALFFVVVFFCVTSCLFESELDSVEVEVSIYRDSLGTLFSSVPETLDVESGVQLYFEVSPLDEVDSVVVTVCRDSAEIEKMVQGARAFDEDAMLMAVFNQLSEAGDYSFHVAVYNADTLIAEKGQVLSFVLRESVPLAGVISETGNLIVGGYYKLSVAVDTTVGCQWYKNGETLSGETNEALEFLSLGAPDSGVYFCVVTNGVGSDTTNSVIVSFGSAPTLTVISGAASPLEPTAGQLVTILAKDSAGFVFKEWGGDTYLFNDRADSLTTFIMPDTSVSLAALYEEVGDAPQCQIGGSGSMVLGGEYRLVLATVGEGIFAKTWYKNEFPVSGQEGDTLAFDSLTEENEGSYFVVVENSFGVDTSNTVAVSLGNQAPQINKEIIVPSVEEGSTFATQNLSTYASDSDGDELTWVVSGGTHVSTRVTGDVVQFFVDSADWYGEEVLLFAVTDQIDTAKTHVVCRVTPVNDAPTFLNSGGGVVLKGFEGKTTSIVLSASDVEGDEVSFSLGEHPDWISLLQNGNSVSVVAAPAYDFLGQSNPDTSLLVDIRVSDALEPALATTTPVKVEISNVNRMPDVVSIPHGSIALGDTYVTTLSASDSDGDVLHVVATGGVVYDSTTKELSWESDFARDDVGEEKEFSVVVSDGEDEVTISWRVTVGKSSWEEVGVITEEVYDIAGKNEDVLYLSGNSISRLQISSSEIHSVYPIDSKYSVRTLDVFGEEVRLYCSWSNVGAPVGNYYYWLFEDGGSELVELKSQGGSGCRYFQTVIRDELNAFVTLQSSYKTTQGKLLDDFLPNDTLIPGDWPTTASIVGSEGASHLGVNVFMPSHVGGVYRKYGKYNQWQWDQSSTERFVAVTPASLTGSITYLVNDAGNIYKTTNGTSTTAMNPTLVPGAPGDIVALEAIDEKVLWALSSTGKLYFTNGGFANNDWTEEDVDGKVVKAISVAEDRSTIFILTTDNTIYRY